MSNKTEIQEFVEICNTPEIRHIFKDKIFCPDKGRNRDKGLCLYKGSDNKQKCEIEKCRVVKPYLPTINQLFKILGNTCVVLRELDNGNYIVESVFNHVPIITPGQSARCALAKAVKEILK